MIERPRRLQLMENALFSRGGRASVGVARGGAENVGQEEKLMRLLYHPRHNLLRWEWRCKVMAEGESIMTKLHPSGLQCTGPASPSSTSVCGNNLRGWPRESEGVRGGVTHDDLTDMSNADRHTLLSFDKSTAVRAPCSTPTDGCDIEFWCFNCFFFIAFFCFAFLYLEDCIEEDEKWERDMTCSKSPPARSESGTLCVCCMHHNPSAD